MGATISIHGRTARIRGVARLTGTRVIATRPPWYWLG
jgi:UDP-N-acetylglucosamine enolpyruvyl transferase